MGIGWDGWKLQFALNNYPTLATCDVLILDEVSMLNGADFDQLMHRINLLNEKRNVPMSLMIVGDPMQLPPVESETGFFFNGTIFSEFDNNSIRIDLNEVLRQDNKDFIEMLTRIRVGTQTKQDIDTIKSFRHHKIDMEKAVHLTSLRINVIRKTRTLK